MSAIHTIRAAGKAVLPARVVRGLRRLEVAWKSHQLNRFQPYTISKTVEGESFLLYIAEPLAKRMYDCSTPWREMAFIRDRMLSPDDLVFDIGCHQGCATVFLARHAASVVAMEPHPFNIAIIEKNVALNGLLNVRVCHAAAGRTSGETRIETEDSQAMVLRGNPYELPTALVEVVSLDDLAEKYGFPTLIKIDVEGFEAEILKGAERVLERRPKIALEVHNSMLSRYGSSHEEVMSLVSFESYKVWFSKEDDDSPEEWNGLELSQYDRFHLFLLP